MMTTSFAVVDEDELRAREDEALRGLEEEQELRGLGEDDELRGFAEDQETSRIRRRR